MVEGNTREKTVYKGPKGASGQQKVKIQRYKTGDGCHTVDSLAINTLRKQFPILGSGDSYYKSWEFNFELTT